MSRGRSSPDSDDAAPEVGRPVPRLDRPTPAPKIPPDRPRSPPGPISIRTHDPRVAVPGVLFGGCAHRRSFLVPWSAREYLDSYFGTGPGAPPASTVATLARNVAA